MRCMGIEQEIIKPNMEPNIDTHQLKASINAVYDHHYRHENKVLD